MSRILIVYGSAYGQTESIAQRIARGLAQAGHRVSTLKGNHLPDDLSPADYDGFIIAASVLFGRHQRYVQAFVRRHVARLNVAPSAFVSVCGAAAGSAPQGPMLARGYADKFLRETGWHPRATRCFAGALPYTRYGLFVRWMMRMISRRTGRPTDTSRDYDFTDWNEVDRFTAELAEALAAPEPAGVSVSPSETAPRGAYP
jgi:menaquinone-dependent protoporphyrinogen oxidase